MRTEYFIQRTEKDGKTTGEYVSKGEYIKCMRDTHVMMEITPFTSIKDEVIYRGEIVPSPEFRLPTIFPMEDIPRGKDPSLYDNWNAMTVLGRGWVIMHEGMSVIGVPLNFFILVNTTTGQRVRVSLTEWDERRYKQIWKEEKRERGFSWRFWISNFFKTRR